MLHICSLTSGYDIVQRMHVQWGWNLKTLPARGSWLKKLISPQELIQGQPVMEEYCPNPAHQQLRQIQLYLENLLYVQTPPEPQDASCWQKTRMWIYSCDKDSWKSGQETHL